MKTNLEVRLWPSPPAARAAYVLTDAAGEPLPLQREVTISSTYDGDPTVTVTFLVDGERIRLTDKTINPPEPK